GRLETLCLLLEPLVGLGELELLRTELVGERGGLLEELLGAHRSGDGVEHDADRLGQLIEEREMNLIEAIERSELDDGLHLALEKHRQHDDVARLRLAEAGTDLDVIAGHLFEENALFFEYTLTDQPFAHFEGVGQQFALTVGPARQQLEHDVALFADVDHVEY